MHGVEDADHDGDVERVLVLVLMLFYDTGVKRIKWNLKSLNLKYKNDPVEKCNNSRPFGAILRKICVI